MCQFIFQVITPGVRYTIIRYCVPFLYFLRLIFNSNDDEVSFCQIHYRFKFIYVYKFSSNATT